jgi:hypothetical protein
MKTAGLAEPDVAIKTSKRLITVAQRFATLIDVYTTDCSTRRRNVL